MDDPHFAERGVFMQAEDAEHGRFRQVAPILAGGVRDQPEWIVRPAEESDAQALLQDAGYSAAEIEEMRLAGAVQ